MTEIFAPTRAIVDAIFGFLDAGCPQNDFKVQFDDTGKSAIVWAYPYGIIVDNESPGFCICTEDAQIVSRSDTAEGAANSVIAAHASLSRLFAVTPMAAQIVKDANIQNPRVKPRKGHGAARSAARRP